MRITLPVILGIVTIPFLLGTLHGVTQGQALAVKPKVKALVSPANCPGNQPAQLTVARPGQATLNAFGGGEDCYWEIDHGYGEVMLYDGEGWFTAWTMWAPGGAGEEMLSSMTVNGTYSEGTVVAIVN